MKKLYLIVFGMLGLVSSMIAENLLIQENRIWEYHTTRGNDYRIDRFCFDGTEECNGKIYNKWKHFNTASWNRLADADPVETPVDTVAALLREEEGKVYMLLEGEKIRQYDPDTCILSAPYTANEGMEGVLYDFTVGIGDSYRGTVSILWISEGNEISPNVISEEIVKNVDQIELNNGTAKSFTVEAEVNRTLVYTLEENAASFDWDNLDAEIVLEGNLGEGDRFAERTQMKYAEVLGNVGRGNMTSLTPWDPIFLTSGFMDYEVCSLTSVYDKDGTVIYGIPYSGITEIEKDRETDQRIFGIFGLEIHNPLPGSIYIRGGKKFVAK